MLHHSRKNPRLKNWDYSSAGMYFVTTCTAERRSLLGTVSLQGSRACDEARFVPSLLGTICEDAIREAAEAAQGLDVEAHVVMPNHIHLLVRVHDGVVRRNGNVVSDLVASIKGRTTHRARQFMPGLVVWQRGFHDSVIRDEQMLQEIRRYIQENPAKWALDRYHVQDGAGCSPGRRMKHRPYEAHADNPLIPPGAGVSADHRRGRASVRPT